MSRDCVLVLDHQLDRKVSMNKSSSLAVLLGAIKRCKVAVSTEQETTNGRIDLSLGDPARKGCSMAICHT
jgi:hypothetical protein